jgi:hypothetical protein
MKAYEADYFDYSLGRINWINLLIDEKNILKKFITG